MLINLYKEINLYFIMGKEKLLTGVAVGDLMTRNFISIKPENDLQFAAKFMTKKRVGSLLVVEKNLLRGILTEKDIVWAVVKKGGRGLKDTKVKDLMRRKVVTIKASSDIVEALDRMKRKKVRRLPVVENKKAIGMITINDILKIDPGLFHLIEESYKIKEQTAKLKKGRANMLNRTGVCQECGNYDLLYQEGDLQICEKCVS
jgi:CBS domain-containing protein